MARLDVDRTLRLLADTTGLHLTPDDLGQGSPAHIKVSTASARRLNRSFGPPHAERRRDHRT
ncbi:MAG: hypothetical protein ACRDT1_07925, partial [Micromonosporaceae bacterium]